MLVHSMGDFVWISVLLTLTGLLALALQVWTYRVMGSYLFPREARVLQRSIEEQHLMPSDAEEERHESVELTAFSLYAEDEHKDESNEETE